MTLGTDLSTQIVLLVKDCLVPTGTKTSYHENDVENLTNTMDYLNLCIRTQITERNYTS